MSMLLLRRRHRRRRRLIGGGDRAGRAAAGGGRGGGGGLRPSAATRAATRGAGVFYPRWIVGGVGGVPLVRRHLVAMFRYATIFSRARLVYASRAGAGARSRADACMEGAQFLLRTRSEFRDIKLHSANGPEKSPH